jgi:hypothetical protein
MKLKFLLFTIVINGIFAVHAYSQNTNFGIGAGSGSERNTSIGFQAGNNISAPDNTFVGHLSGSMITTGNSNSFFGSLSGAYSTSGNFNSFFGRESGILNSGSYNCFYGISTGQRSTGWTNSFFGSYSGKENSTGAANSFFGYQSGTQNTSGHNNTFLGSTAGSTNMGGIQNTFVGSGSGSNNVAGNNNTFLGFGAGRNSLGSGNVFIGNNAGHSETGSNKLYIANSSIPLIYGDFIARNIGIGTTSPGPFRLAINGSALAMGGVWTNSDRRFKQNEKIIDNPLGKIKKLQGVTYEFKKNDAFERSFDEGNQVGFIAQDLQQILPELVKQDGDGYLAVNYQGVIPVLVEAVKELSAQVEVLKTIVNKNVTNIQNSNVRLSGVSLEQSHPNPSAQSTTIRYTLSHEVTSSAIYVFDMQGHPVITFDQLTAGKGEINLMAQQLPAGLYYYTLVANGIIQDTKSMILTKD